MCRPGPSSAAFGQIGDAYVKEIQAYAKDNGLEVVHFKKGENNEQMARPLIDAAVGAGGDGGVVLIGVAQERTPVWRSWPAKGPKRTSPARIWSGDARAVS